MLCGFFSALPKCEMQNGTTVSEASTNHYLSPKSVINLCLVPRASTNNVDMYLSFLLFPNHMRHFLANLVTG